MKVTYLYHSGFVVELENTVLIFDYFKGEIPAFDISKQVYFFVSHKHQDHFNQDIFKIALQFPKTEIFLGSDIRLSEKYLARIGVMEEFWPHIHTIGKNQTLNYQEIHIETLRSTDAGVAFLVEVEQVSIYHGGDLNWWHWNGESKHFNTTMAENYKKEIDFIKGRNFSVAFIPVDPRLENAVFYGIDYFVKNTSPQWIFPMHMWDDYSIPDKIPELVNFSGKPVQIGKIEKPGQEFILWNM